MIKQDRESKVLAEIQKWEKQLHKYEATDFEMTYDKWVHLAIQQMNPATKERLFAFLDTTIFHLNSVLQSSQIQNEAREKILAEARIFNKNIAELGDLRTLTIDQLIHIAELQTAQHRLLSFIQGGISGTGGVLLVGADIPAMAVINLRAIQLIGMSYGFDVRLPFETMMSLKVFKVATLPRRFQAQSWTDLMNEFDADQGQGYFYDGDEAIASHEWLATPLSQLVKTLFIVMLRNKTFQGIPLVGIGLGAGLNYRLTKRVTDFAHRFYQLRLLSESRK